MDTVSNRRERPSPYHFPFVGKKRAAGWIPQPLSEKTAGLMAHGLCFSLLGVRFTTDRHNPSDMRSATKIDLKNTPCSSYMPHRRLIHQREDSLIVDKLSSLFVRRSRMPFRPNFPRT
jgi:hypothetical protein